MKRKLIILTIGIIIITFKERNDVKITIDEILRGNIQDKLINNIQTIQT